MDLGLNSRQHGWHVAVAVTFERLAAHPERSRQCGEVHAFLGQTPVDLGTIGAHTHGARTGHYGNPLGSRLSRHPTGEMRQIPSSRVPDNAGTGRHPPECRLDTFGLHRSIRELVPLLVDACVKGGYGLSCAGGACLSMRAQASLRRSVNSASQRSWGRSSSATASAARHAS